MAPPFLAVTLDAKRRIARAAKSLSLDVGPFGWGYLELLEHVWERKDPRVSALVLSACFGPDERVPAALVEFGFLMVVGEGAWELAKEEADRLLLTHKQRVAAGKARSEAAGRSAGGTFQHNTSGPPAADQRATSGGPALTPSTQHPAPSTGKKRAGVPPAAPKDPDWRMKPTIDALCATYLKARGVKYPFDGGKEAKCVERLLARAPPETLLPAWTRALAEGGYPKVATLLEFERALPHFLGTAPAQTGQRRPTGADPNQGILTRERMETAEEIEEANRRAEEWVNGG